MRHAISFRSDDHGQPTIFEFQPGASYDLGPHTSRCQRVCSEVRVRSGTDQTSAIERLQLRLDLVGGLGV